MNLDNLLAQGWRGRGSAALPAYVDTRDPVTLAQVRSGLAERGITVDATTHAGRRRRGVRADRGGVEPPAGPRRRHPLAARRRRRDHRPRLDLVAGPQPRLRGAAAGRPGAARPRPAGPARDGCRSSSSPRCSASQWDCGRRLRPWAWCRCSPLRRRRSRSTCAPRGLPRSSRVSSAWSSSWSSVSSPAIGSRGGPTSNGSGRPDDPRPGHHDPRTGPHLPVRGARRRGPVRSRPQRQRPARSSGCSGRRGRASRPSSHCSAACSGRAPARSSSATTSCRRSPRRSSTPSRHGRPP